MSARKPSPAPPPDRASCVTTRLRPLPWGGTTPPSPAPPDVPPHTARGWEDLAVRRQRLPSHAPCCCPCTACHAVAASCALARLSLRPCSLCRRVCTLSPLERLHQAPLRRRAAS